MGTRVYAPGGSTRAWVLGIKKAPGQPTELLRLALAAPGACSCVKQGRAGTGSYLSVPRRYM